MLCESANEGRDRKKGRKHNSSGFPDSVTIIIAAKDHWNAVAEGADYQSGTNLNASSSVINKEGAEGTSEINAPCIISRFLHEMMTV